MANLVISGDTSGSVTLSAPAVSGTTVLTLPTTSGTIVTTGSAASLTTSGNLTFTGTGNRITGDFSNATPANRVLFQTSTTNGSTALEAIPNGTSTTSFMGVSSSSSDPANSSVGGILMVGATEFRIQSVARGTGTALPLTMFTGGSERLRIDTSGNVGIGTSSPQRNLVVYNSATSFLALQNTTTGTANVDGFQLIQDTTAGYVFQYENMPIIFGTNDIERMRIDSSGRLFVGYGASAVGYNAGSVGAVAYITKKGASNGLNISGNVFNISWSDGLTGAHLWIDTTDLGQLDFVSDYRIKRNIETQTAPALEKVMALRPVTYQMADYGNLFKASEEIKEGFIAHEVQAVIPSGADGKKDAENQIQSLRLDAILAVAVKAIQELNAKVTALEAQLGTE
jgi:hypothetical protein